MQPREALGHARVGTGVREAREADLSHGRRDAEMIDEAHECQKQRKDHGDPTAPERSPEGREGDSDGGPSELERPQHTSNEVAREVGVRDHLEDGAGDDRAEEQHGGEPCAERDPEHRPKHGACGEGHGRRWFLIGSPL